MDVELVLNRAVTKAECPWLDGDLPEGQVVYRYDGCTYGCVSPSGTACTMNGELPFWELPSDALTRKGPTS